MRIPSRAKLLVLSVLIAFIAIGAGAQDLASFEKKVTTKVLPNGLTILVIERPGAPVFSFYTHVDAGTAQEVAGITGLAHMFEHMAFKGTDTIGTNDWPAEQVALAKVEQAWHAYDMERRKPSGRNDARVAELEKVYRDSIVEAQKFVVSNEFGEIIDREGGTGLNASTFNDQTVYYYSLPANRLELWAYLESVRFLRPVMREFYKERDVVMEERRLRVDSNPIGKLIEQFLSVAFNAHPYGVSGIGWPSDLQTISATDAEAFYRKYYAPSNMTIAIAGEVRAAEVLPMMEKYFGRIPAGPKPEPLRTVEPTQVGEKRVILTDASQPFYVEGYHKPAITHPDNAVYEAISDLLSNGRTSRLYRALVRDQKIAAVSAGFNNFPGDKYPNLFVLFAVPTPGHSPDELATAIREQIELLRTVDVSDDDLKMVKTRAKAELIRGLDSNQGLATALATAQSRFGDWREVFRQVDKIEKVTKQDIRRVANEVFVESNRTVGIIESTRQATAK